ncbi:MULTISPECIES: hypothetical protein [Nocardiaceae]|uniref:ESX-1 secretion-associated protein n=1 Tax=Rhodococcoides corynebacterioides TaxID=53972 RepID=A0ABS2KUW5_9NOCA|nr:MULTISPECIES: hypothetical protein [Rhodococcus]MBM7415740.1 hypothetical protein [Rhodococcus corynebacterioides]MBP1118202.1 hypothetical protein [Rhodococcus sp. PvP016]
MTLDLSDSAASQCASACDRFIDELAVLVKLVGDSNWAAGFGTLPSGIALARKYSDLTHGPEGSLSSVLAAHITAVTNLREAFLEAGRGYQATEDDSTSRIGNTGPR